MHDLYAMYKKTKEVALELYEDSTVGENFFWHPRASKMSDIDVISLAVVAESTSIDSENLFFCKLQSDYSKQFPQLISRSRFNRRRRALSDYVLELGKRISMSMEIASRIDLVDSVSCPVVRNADDIDIYLNNSVHMKGKVVRRNKEKDVALVKVNGITTVPVRLATSRPEIGTDVYAVGTPADRQLNQSITKGILSGQRTLEGINYLQTDASISPGNSGGALTNGKGELVGIVTSKLIGVGAEGLGFAIPLSEALDAVNATVTK